MFLTCPSDRPVCGHSNLVIFHWISYKISYMNCLHQTLAQVRIWVLSTNFFQILSNYFSEYWFCLINNNQDDPQNGYPFSLQGIMCAPCQSLAVLVPTASNSFDFLFVYCYSQCRSLKLFYVLLYVTLCPF